MAGSIRVCDFDAEVRTFLTFLDHFRGSLTMLSSQAIYSGLTGEVEESVDHVPNMPYGFTKLACERFARRVWWLTGSATYGFIG